MGGGVEKQSISDYSMSGLDSDSASDNPNCGNRQKTDKSEDGVDGRRFLEWKRRILQQTEMLKKRAPYIEDHRQNFLRYTPGQWLVETGGITRSKFEIPKVTTLLLVGPMGAGKSTLINNLLRVVNKLDRGFDRAQVCDNPNENGTFFLEEYLLCESSKRICAFDTRGLLEADLTEDLALLEHWIQEGVHHGQMVIRSSDSSNVKSALERKGRHGHHKLSQKREVNFVIFVVSAVAIHKMRTRGNIRSQACLTRLFKSPYLTFKDDRPVVVMTHGDELCMDDRLAARIVLGKILGLSPLDQIFDISGFSGRLVEDLEPDLVRDMALLEMLEYVLQRADWNLPYKMGAMVHIKQALEGATKLFYGLDGAHKIAVLSLVFCWFLLLGLFLAVTFAVICESGKVPRFSKKKNWYY